MKAWTAAPLSCLIADRAYDDDAFRAWLAQQVIKAVIPARFRHRDPQPYDPEAYKARNAAERGLGWFQWWRCVARYDKHAHRCLVFLYLAGT